MSATSTLEELRVELSDLRGTMVWAFAHGHGCTIGDHPLYREVRERDAYLCARIRELEG